VTTDLNVITEARKAVDVALEKRGHVMAQGHLPAAFALPAGLGDIALGVSAPFVARRLAHGTGRIGAVRFNVLGILDLIVAGIHLPFRPGEHVGAQLDGSDPGGGDRVGAVHHRGHGASLLRWRPHQYGGL